VGTIGWNSSVEEHMWQPQNQFSSFISRWRILATARANGLLMLPLLVGGVVSIPTAGSAQIVPDDTLPTNSSVLSRCTVCTITGGTLSNGNWLHSFSQFSIPSGGEAFFNNVDPAIQNIITRVTGGSISQIDGVLRANGNANLFLINPSGIIFGANAQLNIGGSFVASTADRLRFSNGSEFSAVNPAASPLLTVSVPVGLQYGTNPGQIEVQGPGNNLFVVAPPFQIVRDFRPSGLQVQAGQSLALVGGDVLLQGGNLTVAGGRVELGSVAGGTVALRQTNPGWAFSYQGIENFGEVRLSQAASVDASGNSGGVIQVHGRNISLTEGSSLLTLTTGSGSGGQLNLHATESVDVSGSFIDPVFGPLFPSSLLTEVDLGATGRGGDLRITTDRLRVTDGAKVSVSTSGPGAGGELQIQAQTVELARSSPFFGPSQLAADASNPDSGQGGTITLNTNRLLLDGGGWMTAIASGTGSAGTIRVTAQSIELAGGDPMPGLIATQVNPGSGGDGGNIRLDTNRLHVSGGAQVSTSTFGLGNAGRLQVFAQDIDVTGGTPQSPSGLFSTVNPGSSGQGGNLEITTGRLRVADGAQIAADTLGDGNAGNLIVNARTVELVGFNQQGRSGLFAGAIIGTGSGGDIDLTSDRLIIQNGATISASNFPSRNSAIPSGQGAAGDIWILSNSISLNNSSITASTVTGGKGNVDLRSRILTLNNNSLISTNSQGSEPGGNIQINTDFLVGYRNSDITANAVNARGGQVTVTAQGIFGIAPRDRLTPESDITATSDLGIEFNGVVQLNTPGVDPSRGLGQLPDGIDNHQRIVASCEPVKGNEFVITGRGGLPEDASQMLRGGTVWEDLRAAQSAPPKKTSSLNSHNKLPSTKSSVLEAHGWITNANGRVELVATASDVESRANHSRNVQCAAQL
jgi:filamentous hemagglutinin family protein